MSADDLAKYRSKLQKIIKRKKTSVVLDAKDFCNPGRGTALFQLSSGRYQPEFVSLWQLFDQKEFADCRHHLALLVQEVRKRTAFGTIVTCTITAKHLMDSIRAEVETADAPVEVHYFGPYPFTNVEHGSYPDLSRQRVLILTDVVATGTLVKQMTRTVMDLDGYVVGAVCVVATGADMIKQLRRRKQATSAEYVVDKNRYPLDCLTYHEIKSFAKEDFDKREPIRLCKIDPVTVFPEDRSPEPPPHKNLHVCFNAQTMIEHLEDCNAVEVDFYETEGQYSLTAIRIGALLKSHGRDIWAAIKSKFSRVGNSAIVTTYDGTDMEFKNFVVQELTKGGAKSPPFVMMARRENGVGPWRYFPLQPDVKKLAGKKHIFLLLASSHTSETLRELVASIAMNCTPDKITVICLLNRMGNWTLDFVARIQQLLSGLGSRHSDSKFEFTSIYNLTDVTRNELLNMQKTVDRLLSEYVVGTEANLLTNLVDHDRKHFRNHNVTTHQFANPEPDVVLTRPYRLALNGETLIATRSKTKLLLICGHVATKRNYDPLLKELDTETDKGKLFLYYAVLLGDVSYLKLTGTFNDVRGRIEDRITRLMADRRKHEKDRDLVAASVMLETWLTFGLSLLAYRDQENDYSGLIVQRLTGGLDSKQYRRYPNNFIEHFASERWLMTTSMLLRFAGSSREAVDSTTSNAVLLGRVRQYIATADLLLTGAGSVVGDVRKSKLHQAKSNLNLMAVSVK